MGGKTLCKMKGEKLARDPDAQREMILEPAYICEKCARVARQEKYLCHAMPLAPAADGIEPSRKREGKGKHKKGRKKERKKEHEREHRKERRQARKKDGKDRKGRRKRES